MNVLLDGLLEIIEFAGEGDSAENFDLSIVVDEDVVRVDVTNLLLDLFELVAGADDVVQQVPHFGFQEVAFQALAIIDFAVQHEGEIVECELAKQMGTLTSPLEPHMPAFSKLCLLGIRRISCDSVSSMRSMLCFQVW